MTTEVDKVDELKRLRILAKASIDEIRYLKSDNKDLKFRLDNAEEAVHQLVIAAKINAQKYAHLELEAARLGKYSGYLRSCALSGESDPETYEQFCSHMDYNNWAKSKGNSESNG